MTFTFQTPWGSRLAVTYPATMRVPTHFATIFQQTLSAYHASALKCIAPTWTRRPAQLQAIVARYFTLNGLAVGPPAALLERPAAVRPMRTRRGRVAVLCSGGKDSVHLALRLLETGIAPRDCLLVYVANVNRSESPYERVAVRRIGVRLGMPVALVPVRNGIRLNRMGHNIGLRELLLLVCALPPIVTFEAGRVYLGAMQREWDDVDPHLVGAHRDTQALYGQFLAEYGVPIEVAPHIDYPAHDERWLLEDFIVRHRAVLDLTSSCYTQQNFREQQHARLAAKLPGVPLYHGCGVCLKCLRINAGLLLYDPAMRAAPAAGRARLRAHVFGGHARRFADDPRLSELVAALHAAAAAA